MFYPGPTTDMSLIRLARRSYVRLLTEARAVQALVNFRAPEPISVEAEPPFRNPVLDYLETLADRLYNTSEVLSGKNGEMIPLLGELARPLADAWSQLSIKLADVYPDGPKKQRLLAKRLLQAAPSGSEINLYLQGFVGVNGDVIGGIVTQNVVERTRGKGAMSTNGQNIGSVTAVAGDAYLSTVTVMVKNIVKSAPEAPDELKQKLIALASELERIKGSLQPDVTSTLGDDMKNLAHEATGPKRADTLRLYAKNILAVIKGVAEVASPIVTLIHEILALTGAVV
jgi:hypothetical protein